MSGVPVHETTTHIVSLLFNSSYEVVLEMICGTSLGIIDFLSALDSEHIVSSFSSETLE